MSQIVTMPQLGETVTEGTILTWLVKVGDSVKEDDPIIEISTDKVDTEVPSPFSGIVSALLVEEGETVEVGTPLLELEGDEKEENPSTNKKEKEESKKEVHESLQEDVDTYIRNDKNQKLSPVVRKLAQKHNIEVSDVTGTGNGGRITRKDIEAHINSSEPIVDEKQISQENLDNSTINYDLLTEKLPFFEYVQYSLPFHYMQMLMLLSYLKSVIHFQYQVSNLFLALHQETKDLILILFLYIKDQLL